MRILAGRKAFIRQTIISAAVLLKLYTLTDGANLYACVIVNSEHNDGYDGCTWSVVCASDEVMTPHALAVDPDY